MTASTQLNMLGRYSEQTLLLSGLSADGTRELYKFLDLATAVLREVEIDIEAFRVAQLDFLHEHLDGCPLPYGITSLAQLVPYFLHPHSFVQTDTGGVIVSFKQAPYFRIFDHRCEHTRTWPEPAEVDFSRMLSSTNCTVGPETLGLAVSDGASRLRRYRDVSQRIDGALLTWSSQDGRAREVAALPDFLIDTVHEINYSPAGFFVGVDMNLSADVPAGEVADGAEFDVRNYAEYTFPRSKFFVLDAESRDCHVITPSAACAAHVEVDLADPSVFYVSCHNISKWQSNVIVHGPGSLDKYAYRNGAVESMGTYTDPEFFRITSQAMVVRDGRQQIAVTVYPNKLYLVDTETMTRTTEVVLFDEKPHEAPFVCVKNSVAPLYLAVGENSRHVFLTGASELFVVDLDRAETVERVQFCEPKSFAATAHIGLLNPLT